MRYYKIEITPPSGGQPLTYTSHPQGTLAPPDPGALQVTFDAWTTGLADASINSHIKVFGVSLQTVSQGINYTHGTCKLYGGMGKGLPLANPAQAGVLVNAEIAQSFGNWIGTNMTLDLILQAGAQSASSGGTASTAPAAASGASPTSPNLVLNWKAGQPLATALTTMLNLAYPSLTSVTNMASDLILNYDQQGFFGNLTQVAKYVKDMSLAIKKNDPTYRGVSTSITLDTVVWTDFAIAPAAKVIAFTDLIGQPTWLAGGVLQVTTVMRSDIHVGDTVTLPAGPTTATAASWAGQAPTNQETVNFGGGTYNVMEVHHSGDYKSPQAEAWTSYFNCSPGAAPTGSNVLTAQGAS